MNQNLYEVVNICYLKFCPNHFKKTFIENQRLNFYRILSLGSKYL